MRIADGIPALGLSVRARTSHSGAAETAFDGLPDLGLCLMINPPQPAGMAEPSAERLSMTSGAIVLDGALVDSMIEVQTIGRVEGAARPARRPTRIDAALLQPFAQDLVDQAATLLPRDHWGPRPGRMRAGTYLAGTASLPMVLTAARYLTVAIDLSLGDGARSSTLTLLLPDGAGDEAEDDVQIVQPDPEWSRKMDATVRSAPVRLEAVLPPIKMTLAGLVALRPGDLIEVEGQALQDLRLTPGSLGLGAASRPRMPVGARIGARLGQLDGARAVCIQTCPNDRKTADRDRMQEIPVRSGMALVDGRALGGEQSSAPDRTAAIHGDDTGMPAPKVAAGGGAKAEDDSLSGLGDLPDLPDLPGLGDLPDLPDVR